MRFPAREVKIGNIGLGGNNPIRLQSMTNTDTANVKATIEQCQRIFDAGADYVRISIPSIKNVQHLKEIKHGLYNSGYDKPLIADIHFNPDIALEAARIVEKVRINPGNYIDKVQKGNDILSNIEYSLELEKMEQKLYPLIKVCKEYGTAIRVGTNFGSLSGRIISKYGNTPLAMAEATMEFLRIFEKHNFKNTIISLKASSPIIMVQSYSMIIKMLIEENLYCPIHLGVTEAGDGENGRIKSALGIGALLKEGIGDTIRVSLSEPPEMEIPVAKLIAEPFQKDYLETNLKDNYIAPEFNTQPAKFKMPMQQKAIVISSLNDNNEINNEEKIKPDFVSIEKFCSSNIDKYKHVKFLINSDNINQLNYPNVYPIYNLNNFDIPTFHREINFLNVEGERLNDISIKDDNKTVLVIADFSKAENYSDLYKHFTKEKKFPIVLKLSYNESHIDEFIIKTTLDLARLLIERRIQGLWVETKNIENSKTTETIFSLLQASGIRISKTEFISCPTCSRTTYDLQQLLSTVQNEFSGFPGIKIAVMGCMVNGPGEMADSDYGFIGTKGGNVNLYAGKDILLRNVSLDRAIDELKKELNKAK